MLILEDIYAKKHCLKKKIKSNPCSLIMLFMKSYLE